ncbi:MAG: GNAT family N-acetyltransferase [Bacteroidetes bacterium]|nr:GNAT family N-acetyltransferase [Bacteroidota bacterium]
MSITYRHIEPQDNAEIAEVIRKIFREHRIDMPGTVYTDPTTDRLYELFRTPKSVYWIALDDGVIIGGCGIYPTNGLPDGCVELVKFYVAAEYRGKGVGNTLMQKSIAAAEELGYTQMYLESFPELNKAVSMYLRNGFSYLPAALGNSGHFACNIWMVKQLSPSVR